MKKTGEVRALPGTAHVHTFRRGETFVGMIQHEGRVYVASTRAVYAVVSRKGKPRLVRIGW